MLLADAAAQSEGKLYVMGGGWSVIQLPDVPINMALAIKIAVPWDQANRKHKIRAALLTDDGEPVDAGEGAVQVEGDFEVGRPPGLKAGSDIDAPLAIAFNGMALPQGGYVWILEIDGTEMAREPFRVGGTS